MTKNTYKSRPILNVGETSLVLDFQDNDIALFVGLGVALAEIQAFEKTVALFVDIFQSKVGEKEKPIIPHYVENSDKTLGQMIKLFTDVIKDEEIGQLLKTTKDKRNFLVHHILSAYGWPLMSDDDYLRCYNEINEIRNKIHEAESKLSKFLNSQKFRDVITFPLDSQTDEPYLSNKENLSE